MLSELSKVTDAGLELGSFVDYQPRALPQPHFSGSLGQHIPCLLTAHLSDAESRVPLVRAVSLVKSLPSLPWCLPARGA